jgi:hypothetical protein
VKRTGAGLPALLALVGGGLGWLIEVALVSAGAAVLLPPVSLPVALVGISALVLAAGWPIRQAVHGASGHRVDPFRAMRVVLLAKASTLAGSLLGGAAVGVAIYLASRPVLPSASSFATTLLSVGGAIILIVCGLLVEHWCRVPPEDDGDESRKLVLQGE